MTLFVVLLLWLSGAAYAGDCRAQQVQVVNSHQVQVVNTAIPVAAVPITTGYAVDLAPYQYRVNVDGFSSYSGYAYNKYMESSAAPPQTRAQGGAVQLDAETTNKIAAAVFQMMKDSGAIQVVDDGTVASTKPAPLKTAPTAPSQVQADTRGLRNAATLLLQNKCARCHTRGENSQSKLSMFVVDESTNRSLLPNLPYDKMQKRIESTDPAVVMPPPPEHALTAAEVDLFKRWVAVVQPQKSGGK